MISLSSAHTGGLTWSKISCNRNCELRLNGEVVGTLRRRSFWSSTFLAETQVGEWTLRRGGFFNTGIEILDSSSLQPIAFFKSAWGLCGTLTFTDGQRFEVKPSGWWRPTWSVVDGAGQTILRFKPSDRAVDLPMGAALPENRLTLLIVFLRYRVLQAEQDAAFVPAVAGA